MSKRRESWPKEWLPRNGWYVVKRFKYSFGRTIIDKSHEEFFCPEQRKWLPMVMVAPTTQRIAEALAFERIAKDPTEIGTIHVERHKIPLTVIARRSGHVLHRHAAE